MENPACVEREGKELSYESPWIENLAAERQLNDSQ